MNAETRRFRRRWAALAIGLGILLLGALAVSAQASPTPITLGQNVTGAVTDPNAGVQYSLALGAPQSVKVLVLAVTPGFAPTFRVLDPGGVVILDTANPGTQTIAQGSPNLASPGTYIIDVHSANNTPGQFLISVQPGAPLAPPQALPLGQPINGSVDSQTTRQAYSFSGSPSDVLLLDVTTPSTTSGPVIALRDADSGETLALTSASLGGARFRILNGQRNYLLEITSSDTSSAVAFTVCLATESGSVTCPGSAPQQVSIVPTDTPFFLPTATPFVFPTATPFFLPTATLFFMPTATPFSLMTPTFASVQIDPNGPCEVASAQGATINVRSGPGLGFSVVTKLAPTFAAMVIGRAPDNSWFEVNAGGIIGWVSATVVNLGGNCGGVGVVQMPTSAPPPTNMPTNMPTNAPTNAPSATPTPAPTSNGTPVHLNPIIGRVTLLAPIQINPVSPKLDISASANYGEANLSHGFSPDPYTVGMTTGGSVHVSYLGSACSGFATAHPDLRINFGGGGASLLRIYFVGSNGDPAMVVNDPYGNFYCVDDSFGTVNPTIDFNNPAGGTYDVWIASYAANTTISGELYITESAGNHP